MPVQSLRQLLEAVSAAPGLKNLAGEIRSVDELLARGALERLDAQFAGVYVLFIHDAGVDLHVSSYLASGALANDSGGEVLALFDRTTRGALASPGIGAGIRGLEITAANPLISFCRDLFPGAPLKLPGAVVIERLGAPSEALYFSLDASTHDAVVGDIRRLLAIVTGAARKRRDGEFVAELGLAAAVAGVGYQRSGGLSVREHLTRLLRLMWDKRRDIAALVPIVGKLVRPSAKDEGDK
jgi:hypothetical protein